MSDEDAEFREVLVRNLESRGVLNKLKAELRANVFLAMDQQEGEETTSPLLAPKVSSYSQTREGQLMLELVREFLKFYELDYSLAVFEPECNLEHVSSNREQLTSDLGVKPSHSERPLLHQLVFSSPSPQSRRPPTNPNPERAPTIPTKTAPPTQAQVSDLTPSVSAAGQGGSEFDITNENSDVLAPADEVSDKSDLDDFFSGLGGTGFSQHLLNVKDLVPQTRESSQERPRSARGVDRTSPKLSSLRGAPPLSGPSASLEMELKSILNPEPIRSYEDDFHSGGHSHHSYSESIEELKFSGGLDFSQNTDTSEHTVSAGSVGDLDYVEDVLKK